MADPSRSVVEMVRSLDWQADAACRGHDPELFFPSAADDVSIPKAVCARCPVRLRCLGFAVAAGEGFGIWGGLTDKERRRLSSEDKDRIVRRAAARAA